MKGCRPTAIDQKGLQQILYLHTAFELFPWPPFIRSRHLPPAAVAGRGNGIALSALLDARRIWKGQSAVPAGASLPTGHARLDALLPGGGWPEHALNEILHARDGVGELQLLMPTLARLTQAQRRVVLVGAPMYLIRRPGWPPRSTCATWSCCRPADATPCGLPNSACARAVAPQCCAGRSRPTTAPCAASRSPPKAVRPWVSPHRPCAKRSILRRQRYACASKPAPTPAHPQVPGRPRAGDRPAGQRLAMRRPCSGLAFSCRNWPWTARCVNGAIPTHRWRCSAAQRSAGSCRRSTLRHARSA